jgi:hypothetical protein
MTADGSSSKLLQSALDDFIDSLTGGSFQRVDATADLEQARKVASTGAKLRSAISMARQLELQAAISSDVLSRNAKVALAYMNENLGPEAEATTSRTTSHK